jgi:hypothetical protein
MKGTKDAILAHLISSTARGYSSDVAVIMALSIKYPGASPNSMVIE